MSLKGFKKSVCTKCGSMQMTKKDTCFMCGGNVVLVKNLGQMTITIPQEYKDWLNTHRNTTGESPSQVVSYLIAQEIEMHGSCQ